MTLLAGTNDGIYRLPSARFDEATQVLDCGRTMRVRQFGDEVYAASKTGLYRTTDGGSSWTNLGVPREEVYSVLVSPDGNRLYAGTHPAHLYLSENGGNSWRELTGFQDLPSREEWFTPRHRNEAHIRSLGAHPDEPNRVVAGVEVGGVHVSEDRGETWTERREGVHDDVHHVLVCGPSEFLASCGDGLYRTSDAGETWERLDGALERRYFRESITHEGKIYAAASRSSPGSWQGESGADAALYVSEKSGGEFSRMPYPGEPAEIVLAWALAGGRLVAGTNAGQVIVLGDDGWETGGVVPKGIRSLCVGDSVSERI